MCCYYGEPIIQNISYITNTLRLVVFLIIKLHSTKLFDTIHLHVHMYILGIAIIVVIPTYANIHSMYSNRYNYYVLGFMVACMVKFWRECFIPQ